MNKQRYFWYFIDPDSLRARTGIYHTLLEPSEARSYDDSIKSQPKEYFKLHIKRKL